MRKIGFVGSYDKTDLLTCVAKILVELNQKVILIDSTITQKTRYVVPTMAPSRFYITNYEGIDIAVGFKSLKDIENYQESELDYDIALIDIDSSTNFHNFEMTAAEINYFVTAFDNYSLKRGLEIIGNIGKNIRLTKILFSVDMSNQDNLYLNFLAYNYPIEWAKGEIYFPYNQEDFVAMMENQKSAVIRFKNLTANYKNGLQIIVEQILQNVKSGDVKKVLKTI